MQIDALNLEMNIKPFTRFACAIIAFTAYACAEPLGLVLSGGGAKGAYEVGVWQALEEAGIASNIIAISGTSVGALNAALFATLPQAAESLWHEKMPEVFTLNTNRVGQSIQKTVDDASRAVEVAEETGKDWKGVASFLLASLVRLAGDYAETVASPEKRIGYIDSSKLAAALDESLPKEWPAFAPIAYATAVEKGGNGVSAIWRLNDEPHDRRILMLRASAAIPLGYDTVEIDGKTYVDGGWEWERQGQCGDNVPLAPILENHPEIKTVIVVYLNDERHLDQKRRKKNLQMAKSAGVKLIEIIPSENIGGAFGWHGVFDASPETARRLIELGRKDAEKVLNGLGL